MSVLVISKRSFNQIQHDNVSNIAFSSGNYVISVPGATASYAASDYNIVILYNDVNV